MTPRPGICRVSGGVLKAGFPPIQGETTVELYSGTNHKIAGGGTDELGSFTVTGHRRNTHSVVNRKVICFGCEHVGSYA